MRKKLDYFSSMLTLIGILVINGFSVASASSANISHSYQSTVQIANGSLVSLSSSASGYVDLANTDNSPRLLGLAVGNNESLLALNNSSGTVQVVTNGTATALVSTVNGSISVGDQISTSPFNGIGMKSSSSSKVIGIAQTAFNGDKALDESVRDKNGQVRQIKIGYVSVIIGITTSPAKNTSIESSNFLQRLAISLTGKQVATWRIALGLFVGVVAFVALVTLVYTSIYGSIVSVGRNPLAKTAILKTLRDVLGMVVLIASLASLLVYFLLQ